MVVCNHAQQSFSPPFHPGMKMKSHQHAHRSDRTSWAQDRGNYRDLSSRASSATLRLSQHHQQQQQQQQKPYNYLDDRREKTDLSIAQGLLKEGESNHFQALSSPAHLHAEALNHPRRRSPFNISPLPDSRAFLTGTDGPSDLPLNAVEQDRRKNRNSSNTWTDSSLGTEVEDEEDRTEFVKEYNRLAEKACTIILWVSFKIY